MYELKIRTLSKDNMKLFLVPFQAGAAFSSLLFITCKYKILHSKSKSCKIEYLARYQAQFLVKITFFIPGQSPGWASN